MSDACMQSEYTHTCTIEKYEIKVGGTKYIYIMTSYHYEEDYAAKKL
jgi:hypothetical protein